MSSQLQDVPAVGKKASLTLPWEESALGKRTQLKIGCESTESGSEIYEYKLLSKSFQFLSRQHNLIHF